MHKLLKAAPAAAVAGTGAYISTVGSTGMKQVDQNICELLKAWRVNEYTGCEIHSWVPYIWPLAIFLALIAYAPDLYGFARAHFPRKADNVADKQEPILDCVPDVRLAASQGVLGLFTGSQRDKLIALLTNERLSSWARPMGVGEPDLVRLGGSDWSNHYMVQYDPTSQPSSIHQTFFRTKKRNETAYYDIYLNYEQLKRFWPDLKLDRVIEKAIS